MANGHGGEDYYKTARAEKKGRLRDFAIHVTSPSCRVLSHAPLGFINVRHNSAMYIYIHTFFFSSCAINRRGRIFLHYFSSSCIPEDCYCQSVDRCPHRGEHVYACKTLLYHIFSFTLLFCFLIFFFSFLLLFRNRWNIKFSIRSEVPLFLFFLFFLKNKSYEAIKLKERTFGLRFSQVFWQFCRERFFFSQEKHLFSIAM